MELEIRLKSVQDVLGFVALATACDFPVTLGNSRHSVSGKSFMELFLLNLRHPVRVTLDCSEEEYQRFCRDAQRYLVK